MLHSPVQKLPCFQISHLERVNINAPIKDKKLHHFVITLIGHESHQAKSHFDENLNLNLNFTNNSKIFQTDKSLVKISLNSVDKKLEDVYTEVFEKSFNDKEKSFNEKSFNDKSLNEDEINKSGVIVYKNNEYCIG
jgi:hypothetical protein